ncbi:MAG: type III-B CRISPR module RAMP protein Cmr1 [Desulfobacteraceae bacterium]|nr:type III-B CRISPR module RAMP protein Cmr1 [Desulfobacteraceae bacterium]MBC2720258.1 type III-B CRISPR module RAMP protein Cmr1 [Desulfobacteraceae bacterium]
MEFDLEIVTPMFLGGANTTDAELRVPSIKGMLRFWWRATCGIESIKEMKKEETKIFGSTDQKACFSMKIEGLNNIKAINNNLLSGKKFQVEGKTLRIGIIDYLAFGIRNSKKGYTRQYFPAGSKFKIKFNFYNMDYKQSVVKAFYSFIDNGGLGAKTRNGFGSLCFRENYKNNMQIKGDLQKYSALSHNSKLFNGLNKYNRWEDALSEIGMAYKDARLSVEKKHVYDKRLLIAKPIVQAGNSKERHAKPYFLHIKKHTNGKFQGQILFMPYKYYQIEKHNEYIQVCQKVNEKLSELLKVQT